MDPRPDPSEVVVVSTTAQEAAPLGMEIDLQAPSPASVLTAPLQQAVVLVDPVPTGVMLQEKIFESGMYSVVIVWSDRSQTDAREKYFVNSWHPREDCLAVITHEDGHLEDTLLAILTATTNMTIVAVMCGSEFGVLLEDQIANGLNQKLGSTHLRGSGIPVLNTKVEEHLHPNAIQSNDLGAVREKKRALCQDDVKKVTFNPTVTGVEIKSIDDLTPTEIAALWYNVEEMDSIAKRCFVILKRMEAGEDKRYCIRGLEGHTPLGSKSKKRNRSAAIEAVLTEQAQQQVENRIDDQAIADAYQRATSSCQMRAQIMGKRDQETAEGIHYANGNHHEAKPFWTKTTSQDELALPSSHNLVLDRWGSPIATRAI